MNQKDALAFLQESPNWYLEYCFGYGGNGWWWLRDSECMSDTIAIDGRTANALSKKLTKVVSDDIRTWKFVYRARAAIAKDKGDRKRD